MSSRPQSDEYPEFFGAYINSVPDGDIASILESQGRATQKLLSSIDEERAAHRYAPGKWSIKQLVGHVTDAERVFAYRLVAIARGEKQSLPGFEENDYVDNANFDERSLAELAEGLAATRSATLALARTLSDEAWDRRGVANGNAISARAIAWGIAGHERHHLGILRERYGVA
ncbi:MAG TPA: DinB family protein [Thermoanaerobaculia bacterium]